MSIVKLAFLGFKSKKSKQDDAALAFYSAHKQCFYDDNNEYNDYGNDKSLIEKRNNLSNRFIDEFNLAHSKKPFSGYREGYNFHAKQINDAIASNDKEFESWNEHRAKYWKGE